MSEQDDTRCPACDSRPVRRGPESRTKDWGNGHVVVTCDDCGAAWLVNAPMPPATFTLEDLPEDYVDTWVDNKRESVGTVEWRKQLDWLKDQLKDVEKPRVYDLGAGDGEFLALARDEYGFEVGGNDILEGAILVAKKRYGIDLDLGDLNALEDPKPVDAVTMWCVLAHTADGPGMVSGAARILKPGGLLFLQTPHRTFADRLLIAAKRATGGRMSKLSNRRLAGHHRILHTPESITRLLARHGFTDIVVTPQARYSLTSEAYVASLNPPTWALEPASKAMDKIVHGPLAPRIILDVKARKA